jgi:ABC-type uncharacterized transport system permease subunit
LNNKEIKGQAQNQFMPVLFLLFVYRINTEQRIVGLSEEALKLEMNVNEGAVSNLLHPSEYYYNNRNWGDLITLLIILVYPLYRFHSICYAFWKKISSNHEQAKRDT